MICVQSPFTKMTIASCVSLVFFLGITAVVITNGYPTSKKVCVTKTINNAYTKVSIKTNRHDNLKITDVRILKTLSKHKCVLRKSYGFYGAYIYTKGCKAIMKVCYIQQVDIGCRVVTLSSKWHEPSKIVFKKGKIYRMSLIKHLNDSKMCKRGVSYGYLKNSAWSMKGCKAQFKICLKK
nr:lectin ADEL-like [Biomphalaria glabrata]